MNTIPMKTLIETVAALETARRVMRSSGDVEDYMQVIRALHGLQYDMARLLPVPVKAVEPEPVPEFLAGAV